ncbi:MAG: RdgB/HAM1 family non-canonical purine NTP pyrophosphatase [Acholeplasmataceae bacterium]|jgi:XTP/dITP diphosphohydrolase|nr:RdgB/HAM1 family non-canonical purine NTP pyrophosphatase [Acholeplasmataceae bacterium]
MKQILLATQNKHKIIEIKEMMKDLPIQILTLHDFSDDEEVEETGTTFVENAYIKAHHFAKKYQLLTFADDSGLVVEALNGRPGIYSQRYSGKGDLGNNLKILEEMKEITYRDAYFVSVIVLCHPNGDFKHFEGRVNGLIHDKIEGEEGFGYDSIFYYPPYHQTFGLTPMDLKNKVSHRANALLKLKEALK